MNLLEITQLQNLAFIGFMIDRFREGGPLGMTLTLICLILTLLLLILAGRYLNKNQIKFHKYKSLANQAALLGLVIGLFNSVLGLIQAFDALEAFGQASQSMIAGGLKVALLAPLFGFIVFLIGRTGTFILDWVHQESR
ncbi:MotA/TolQ/ExbB proton channel family protein [Algoriphagus namhaensis]